MTPSDLDLAYVAGFVDGDGCVTISRTSSGGRYYYAPRLIIAGTDRLVLDLASSWWGGNVWTHTPKNPRHRLQYGWAADGRRGYVAITALEPFLRMKRPQAELAMAFWEHLEFGRVVAPYPWQPPGWDPRPTTEEMFDEMWALNHPEPRLCGR